MVSYTELKQLIDQYIKQNGQQSITGKSLNNVLTEIVSGVFDKIDSYLDVGNIDQMLDENMYDFLTQSNNKVGRFSIQTTDGVLYRGVYFGGYTSGGTEKHIVGIDEYGCFVDLKTSDKGATWTSAIVNEYEKIPLKSVLAAIEQNFTEEEKEVMRTNLGVDVQLDELREEIQTELDSNTELIEDLQNTKIDKEADDYYPQLSVGMADNLAGQEDATPSEFNYRQSGGGAILDGAARIEAVKGNSLVWNQGFQNPQFNDGANRWYGINATFSVENGVGKLVASSASSRILAQYFDNYSAKDHIIMVVCDYKRESSISSQFYVYASSSEGASAIGTGDFSSTARRTDALMVKIKGSLSNIYVYPQLNGAEGDIMYVYSVRLFDLTQMFGAGNEPTTIEEFYARIPQNIDLYAYNEGEVIHSNVDAIESVGFNLWDEKWENGTIYEGRPLGGYDNIIPSNFVQVLPNTQYYFRCKAGSYGTIVYYDENKKWINNASVNFNNVFTTPSNAHYVKFVLSTTYGTAYTNDICINLSSSKNGTYEPYISREQRLDIIKKYFPNGMRSAGTASDEIRWNKQTQKWEKVVRIAEVDLGSLSWTASSDNIFLAPIANVGLLYGYNILTIPYVATGSHHVPSVDKTIALTNSVSYPIIRIKETAYTDAASFKAAMQGVMFYFELATPIVTEIEEDINLDYQVWDGGTEKAIATEPTTPFKADIVYGFNAYGVIKDLRTQIATLQTMLSQMQLAMASMVNETPLEE